MAKKEFAVGEEFQCGLIKLKIIKAKYWCEGCYFRDKKCLKLGDIIGPCGQDRKDKTDVIFVKVEK